MNDELHKALELARNDINNVRTRIETKTIDGKLYDSVETSFRLSIRSIIPCRAPAELVRATHEKTLMHRLYGNQENAMVLLHHELITARHMLPAIHTNYNAIYNLDRLISALYLYLFDEAVR